MNHAQRAMWEARHRDAAPGAPEPSLLAILPAILRLMPHGLVLDVAAGTGRNALVLAEAGCRVIAVDYATTAMHTIAEAARAAHLPITPVVADLESTLPFQPARFDCVVNINYLDRDRVSHLKDLLRVGGLFFFDTFLIDQATLGHPRDPRFLLQRYELRAMLSDMELLHYGEGLVNYKADKSAWRATALARKG